MGWASVTRVGRPSNPRVVETDEQALRKLRSADGAVDVSVEFASNGHEALARLSRTPRLDLVMADLSMPVMDGFALVEKLRADPRTVSLPVLVVSAGLVEMQEEWPSPSWRISRAAAP